MGVELTVLMSRVKLGGSGLPTLHGVYLRGETPNLHNLKPRMKFNCL